MRKRLIFLLSFFLLLDFFLFGISSKTFPYKGFFPYKETALQYSKGFVSKFANFDGVHYLKIAKKGYDQYEQAFFPFYPILIKLAGFIFNGNLLYAAIFVSNLSFFIGTLLLYEVFKKPFGEKIAFWTMVFLIFFPTSFYFHAVYTESLFLLLFAVGLFFLNKYPLLSFMNFYLLGLTRIIGVLVSLVILGFKRTTRMVVAPVLGLLTYMIYLYKTTGDPLFFFNAQPAFGANRSTKLIFLPQVFFRYFKIFLFSQKNAAYLTAVLEFVFFSFALILLLSYTFTLFKEKKIFLGPETGLLFFSWISLVLPTLTGTLSSIPRYLLLVPSLFVFLGKVKNSLLRLTILASFLILHIFLALLFAQGYFIS